MYKKRAAAPIPAPSQWWRSITIKLNISLYSPRGAPFAPDFRQLLTTLMAPTQEHVPPVPPGRIQLQYASFCLSGPAGEPYYGSLSLFRLSPSTLNKNNPPSFVDFSFDLFQQLALSRGHTSPQAWVAQVGNHAIVFGHHPSWLVAIACLDSWLTLGLTSPGGDDIQFYAMNTAELDGQLGRVFQLLEEE